MHHDTDKILTMSKEEQKKGGVTIKGEIYNISCGGPIRSQSSLQI